MYLTANKGARWTLTWRTDVIEAYDGTEQRISLAPYPRQRVEGTVTMEDDDLAGGRALLASSPASAFDLPLPWEAAPALADIVDATVTIDSSLVDWAEVGRSVYVRGPAGDAYTGAISAVAGGDLTVVMPPSGSFPAGSTFVSPLESLALEDGQAFGRAVTAAGQWSFSGRMTSVRSLGGAGAESIPTLAGYDILDVRPVGSSQLQEQLLAGVEFQDAGGSLAQTSGWSRAKPRRQASYLVTSRAERQRWKAFLAARRGRWKAFLAPTWRPDLKLTTFTSGAAWIRIDSSWASYLTRWWPSLAHRWIQLEFADGTVQRRAVTGAATVAAGVEELTLTAAVTGSPANVVAVSLLELARLDTDEVSIEWRSDRVGAMTLPMVVIQG